jgi:hypothetical protein
VRLVRRILAAEAPCRERAVIYMPTHERGRDAGFIPAATILHLQKHVIKIIIAAVFGADDITRHDIVNKILQFPFLQ